jgi:hypothetical protein
MLDGLDRIVECAFCAACHAPLLRALAGTSAGASHWTCAEYRSGSGWLELVKEPVDVTERPVTGATLNSPVDFVAVR